MTTRNRSSARGIITEHGDLPGMRRFLATGLDAPATPESGWVEVVVAARRADDKLSRTLSALWNQTLPPAFIHVVWLGHSRPTLNAQRVNLRHEHLPDGWISHAFNLGLKTVRAPLFMALVAGDEPEPVALECMAWAAMRRGVDAVCDSDKTAPSLDPPDSGWRPRALLKENPYGRTLLWRSDSIRQAGGFGDFDNAGAAGWKLLLGLAENGGSLWRLPLALFRSLASDAPVALRDLKPQALAPSLIRAPERPDVVPVHYPYPFEAPGIYTEMALSPERVGRLEDQAQRVLIALPDLDDTTLTRRVLESVRNLFERGYRFLIVTTRQSDHSLESAFRIEQTDVIHMAHVTAPADYLALAMYLIASRRIDLIFTANCDWAYQAAPLLHKLAPRAPIIDYVTRTGEYDDDWLKASAAADVALSASLFSSRWLMERGRVRYGREHAQQVVQTLNIDTSRVNPERFPRGAQRKADGLSDDAIVLAYMTPLTVHHDPIKFVHIVAGLLNRGLSRPLRAWVLGEGPLLDDMLAQIRHHELGEFFRFWPADKSRLKLLRDSDIVVIPGISHDVSPVTFEAMALGLPIVSGAHGGQADVIGAAGVLVTPGEFEVADYVNSIGVLMADDGRRFALGIAARSRAQNVLDVSLRHGGIARLFEQTLSKSCAIDPGEPDWLVPALDRYRLWVRTEQLRTMWKAHQPQCEPLHEELMIWHRFMPLTRLFPKAQQVLRRSGLFGSRFKRGRKS